MEELFATKIVINKLLNIEDFEIPLSETERKHLIITGKNGSGKTTLLRKMSDFFNYFSVNNAQWLNPNAAGFDYRMFLTLWYSVDHTLRAEFKNPEIGYKLFSEGKFIFAFFEARRNPEKKSPSGIKKVNFKPYYTIGDHAGEDFIQYIVNLKADQAFAKEDNDAKGAGEIDLWFKNFEEHLFQLFEHESAQLQFDRKNYNFNIIEKDKPPYNLNQLSDGYAFIFDIISELIMRMEEQKQRSYDMQGIVLIDEIETHLHVSLQKKILPFLIAFFPKIQFIVSTHSPFVINSVKNAVICDLEKRTIERDLSAFSYKAIVENYFDVDQYSEEIKNDVFEFEKLMEKQKLTGSEKARLNILKEYMLNLQNVGSNELAVKIQQIMLKHLGKKEVL